MHFASALWPSCTSHHAVLSARHPSIHPPCQFPLPVSSSPSISWPHHLSIFLLLLHVEALLSPFCASYFTFISPTNRLILPPSLSLSVNPSFAFTLVSFFSPFHLSPFLYHPYSHPTPPQPFFCQSAVTGFVGVGLAVSMSSHSQQW